MQFGTAPTAGPPRLRPTQPCPRSDTAFAPPFDDATHRLILRHCVRRRRLHHRHLCPEVLAPAGLCCPGHQCLATSSANQENSVAVCHEQFRPDPCPEAFEEAELRVRETMNALACELLGAVIEKRDDGPSRIERDGQSWFRVAVTAKTIMTSLGPLTYRRARYRSGASGASPVPVDASLGLVDDYLTRPAAELGLLMMGHCTAREAAAFFAKIGGMTPSVSTLQRLTRTMHERWETLGPETLDSIRDAEGVPHEAVSASVSLDGVMVPLRAGEDGRAEASWRARPPAARFPSTTPGASV